MNSTNLNNNSSGSQEVTKFCTLEEELIWLRRKLEENQTEFVEFQESSRELETEYETQVKQLEKKNNELTTQLAKLEIENDHLKSKYSIHANDTQHKLNEFQEQATQLQAINTRLNSYIRELEQNNDDLERAQRALAASLEDFEAQLNQQIERNVLLENEVSEKEELECLIQRLKQESRDLKHELIVKQNESVKKKQQMLDSYHSGLKPSPKDTTSLPPNSIHSRMQENAHTLNDKQTSSQLDGGLTNRMAHGSRSPKHLVSSFTQARPSTVDSTTSPQTTPTRFSFSPHSPTASKSFDSRSQQTSSPPSPSMPAMVMSPSSRISALNIVGDLLRKVLSLESKLESAKRVPTN